ncbi:14711_t:CDS:2, partial [Gigaspora rosea]
NQILKQMETSNNNEWFSVELKDIGKYDLTDSLKEFKSVIVEKINNNPPSIAHSKDEIEISKVPSEEEILDDISKLNIIINDQFYWYDDNVYYSGEHELASNHKIGHDFEFTIRQKLNLSNIIAKEVKVNQGDGGNDIIATYKNNL